MAYRDEVLSDDPFFFFEFEDNLNNSGIGSNPSFTKASFANGYADTPTGRGIDLNNDYIAAKSSMTSSTNVWHDDLTLEAMVKFTAGTPTSVIVEYGDATYEYIRLMIYSEDGTGCLATRIETAGASPHEYVYSPQLSRIDDDKWHHIALVRRSGQSFHFVDGQGQAFTTNSSGGYISNSSKWLNIGRDYADSFGYITGMIDNIAIYNTGLSDERMAARYAAIPQPISAEFRGWSVPL